MCRSVILCLLLCSNVVAHEMTPTYPKWEVSYIEGVQKTTMKMFNKRKDASWYEIGIFDKEWKPISFATKNKILKIDYLGHAKFDVYINAGDVKRTEYICSTSKLRKGDSNKPMVASKICSRFK
jgi:hypothetical protein